MSKSSRRVIWFVFVPVLVVAVLGLLAWWGFRSFLAPIQHDTPTQLASVSVPHGPNALAWSADGAYLAAGAWGWNPAGEEIGPSEVFVVDVAKASVTTTLTATGVVQGLAFSPDGKWLAVATRQNITYGAAPAVLVVFDVPAFTAKFTAKSVGPENAFIDIAWAADGKSLHAIDGSATSGGKPEIRRWDVPAFTEQPAIRVPQAIRALAVSPDGRTLAVAEKTATNARMIRLFDLGKGTEQASFKVGDDNGTPRLGFTSDGKAVGVFDGRQLSWWEVVTDVVVGRPAKPDPAGFAIQPAGLSDDASHYSASPDGSKQARGYENHRGFGDLGWDNRANEFGAFVEVTAIAPAKTRTWRVGGSADGPALAFSPDGTKLAGTVKQPGGESILIWAVPK